jgi:hypothetical protein
MFNDDLENYPNREFDRNGDRRLGLETWINKNGPARTSATCGLLPYPHRNRCGASGLAKGRGRNLFLNLDAAEIKLTTTGTTGPCHNT